MQDNRYSILRNSIFNLLGWIVPIIVNFISIPIIVRHLGYDQYGVWTIVMAVMGYFALLDLGVVKGGIRFLAEYNAKNDRHRANQVLSLGMYFYCFIGIVGSLLIASSVDLFILDALKIPPAFIPVARTVLYLAAPGFVITMMQTYLLSLPQAVHRFDISNKVDVTTQVLTTIATVFALWLGYALISVILLRIVGSLMACIALYAVARRYLPYFRLTLQIERCLLEKVFSYSLVSFIGRLGSTTANYVQTLVVGSILGTSAVTIFSIPFQLISRTMNLSCQLSMVMLPISSELGASAHLDRLHEVYLEMTRYIFFLNLAQVVMFVLFSRDILSLWMGRQFAEDAHTILVYIAIGFFFDTLTNLPSQVNDGLSHPKVTSTFAFLRGIAGILFAIAGGIYGGVQGVAFGFMLSCILLSVFFNLYVHKKTIKLSLWQVIHRACGRSILFGLFVLAVFAPLNLITHWEPNAARFMFKLALVSSSFAFYGYAYVLDDGKRLQIREKCTVTLKKVLSLYGEGSS